MRESVSKMKKYMVHFGFVEFQVKVVFQILYIYGYYIYINFIYIATIYIVHIYIYIVCVCI